MLRPTKSIFDRYNFKDKVELILEKDQIILKAVKFFDLFYLKSSSTITGKWSEGSLPSPYRYVRIP